MINMMLKVVINKCYGGFGISKECCERMAELGSKKAKERLEHCEKYDSGRWYGYIDVKRHDKYLVQAVEELGEKADGPYAKLEVVKVYIPDEPYTITEYDGYESVA